MTDRSTLPQYKGRPVPWVTRWTDEIATDRYALALERDRSITYSDRNNNRDSRGILWQREGISRGGEPDWAAVSTYRQRRSMSHRLCQVCGDKIPDGAIRWLMPLGEGYEMYEKDDGSDGMVTWNPPTCDGCIEIALDLCPHLKRNGYQILKVLDYEYWGVSGLALLEHEGSAYPVQTVLPLEPDTQLAPFSEEELRVLHGRIMAQQAVVKFGTYVIEKVDMGSRPQETPTDAEQQQRNFLRNLQEEIAQESEA